MSLHRVLIGYDGSQRARRAIRVATALLEGAEVLVLHVRLLSTAEPVAIVGAPMAWEGALPTVEQGTSEEQARRVADEGVRKAAAGGLRATARVERVSGAERVAHTIVAVADEYDAGLIVLGSHWHGPLRAVLLGSVSAGVLAHTQRPVLVVPQPD